MRRRALLASGAALLPLAGCVSAIRDGSSSSAGSNGAARLPTASLSMEPIEVAELPSKVCYTVPTEYGTGEPTPEGQLIERAERDGSATVERTREPLPDDRPIVYRDAVYQLDYEVVAETPATDFSVKIDVVTGDEPDGRTVRFSELPEVDREVFARRGFDTGEVVGIGTTLLYTDAQVERSALVPETDIVIIEWANGNRAEWVVDGSHETTLNTYRYTIAETTPASEYGSRIRERYEWGLSGLSEAERDVVETAIREERGPNETPSRAYVVGPEETPPEPLVALVDRFRSHDRVREDEAQYRNAVAGPYLVRYEGTLYWAQLSVYGPPLVSPTPT